MQSTSPIFLPYPPTVLATSYGLRSPRGVTLNPAYLNDDSFGNRVVRSGSLISYIANGYGRVFPATKVTAAVASAATSVPVANASVLRAGDVLKRDGSTAVGTIASVNYATNMVTLAAGGSAIALSTGDTLIADDGGSLTAPNYTTTTTPTTGIAGMVVSHIDLSQTTQVGVYTSASVYLQRVPVWNSTIAALFPEIQGAM